MQMLWTILTLVSAAAPSVAPGELLLDYDVRGAYVAQWSPAHLLIQYRAPTGALADRDMQPLLETPGVLIEGARGPEILAAAAVLAGVARVDVFTRDGRQVGAHVVAPASPQDAAAVRIVPDSTRAFDGLPVLMWAPTERVQVNARAWMLEEVGMRGPDGELFPPVLVDTVLGGPVEAPLSHLWAVAVRLAEGRPLLDHEGRVLCFIFRTSGTGDASLCAPREALAGRPQADTGPSERLNLQRL